MYVELIKKELNEAARVLEAFMGNPANIEAIEAAADVIVNSFQNGGKVFSFGNGGSHCDAMHFAEELTGRYRDDREPFAAIAISDPSHISCVSNDFGYERIFSRFLKGLGKKEDVILAISTSGNSKNVLGAAEYAKSKGMKVLALTGKNGGKLAEYADVLLNVAHEGYADRIQEVHIKIIHILILLIEKKMTENAG